jgi:chromosomal replication initiator protein
VPDAVSEDLAEIWQRVREELEASFPSSTFDLWLEPLRVVGSRGSTLYLQAPPTIRSWVDRRYGARIRAALRKYTPSLTEIALVAGEAARSRPASEAEQDPPLNPGHSFERFVIGDANRFAHAAALAVAELPGESYNPLFLHGAPGLGKTHLLGAIAAYLRRHHPGLRVRLTTGERFTDEFVTAIRRSGADAFKHRHRDVDVLLIDDVQFIEDKARTEEEFFHTFNALHEAGHQIVLTSDRPPHELSRIAERLRDRFEWGLCAELRAPDLRARMTLLWRLVTDGPFDELPADALRELAVRVPSNVRRLEGALTRVTAIASLTRRPVDAALIDEAIALRGPGAATASGEDAPSVEAIQEAVCAVLHLSRDELLSTRRTPRVARARQLAMYLSRELTDQPLAQIARAFHRDHSTVLHAIRRINTALEPGSGLETQAADVRALLHATAKGNTSTKLST